MRWAVRRPLRPWLGGGARRASGGRPLAADRIHTRRLRRPLGWLRVFLAGTSGAITRTLRLGPPPAPRARITCDASPWGFGAVLYVEGRAVSWIAEPLNSDDERRFRAVIGESSYISTWEALSMLVALRTWAAQNSPVELRTDSACAIASLTSLRSKSSSVLKVALELALDLAEDKFEVLEVLHIPGVTNTEADALSRLWAPKPLSVPFSLRDVRKATPANRGLADFWRTSGAPRNARLQGQRRFRRRRP